MTKNPRSNLQPSSHKTVTVTLQSEVGRLDCQRESSGSVGKSRDWRGPVCSPEPRMPTTLEARRGKGGTFLGSCRKKQSGYTLTLIKTHFSSGDSKGAEQERSVAGSHKVSGNRLQCERELSPSCPILWLHHDTKGLSLLGRWLGLVKYLLCMPGA